MSLETIFEPQRKIHQRLFADISEFQDFATGKRDSGVASREIGNTEWYGSIDFPEALRHCVHGWPEGADKVRQWEAVFSRIISEKTLLPEPQACFTGEYFDMGLAMSGVPECWFKLPQEESPSNGKIVRVAVNLSASAAYTGDDMMRRGAASAALVQALEMCGKSVELTVLAAISSGHGNGDVLQYVIPAKKAGEMLDIDRLSFLCAHPGCFRRLIFSCMEGEDSGLREQFGISPGAGYGYPGKAVRIPADIIVPEMLLGRSDGDMIAWVLKELEKQGVELKKD